MSTENDVKKKKKAVPAVGHDFDIEETKTRGKISYILLSGTSVALTASALYCYKINDFSGLKETWGFVGPLITFVIGYYFPKK